MTKPKIRKRSGRVEEYDEGLFYAILALSFFRGRHQGRKRYKHARPGSARDSQVDSCFVDCLRDARQYIRLARQAGFRGSIIKALEE